MKETPMDFTKDEIAMIRASAYGLDGPATEHFQAAISARLDRLIDSGTVKRALINKDHIRAAVTAELASGK